MQISKVGAIFDRLLDFLMYIGSTLLIVAMLIVCTEVISRYVFNRSMGWPLEVTELLLVGIVSLGIAWLLKVEGHIKVDFLLNRLNPKHQALVIGITSALGALAVLIITTYGLRETINLYQAGARETGLLRMPKAYLLFPLVCGCFLFFIQLGRRSYKHFKAWRASYVKEAETLDSIKGGRQPWNGI